MRRPSRRCSAASSAGPADRGAGPEGLAGLGSRRHPLRAIVREVVRFDPPVQNTRRFIAADGVVAGQPMRAGDAVLVVLAAANRDPVANPEPARFDPRRRECRAFTFGLGAHACPGEELATSIAEAGVRRLLAAGVNPRKLAAAVGASDNARIPLFHAAATGRR